MTTLIRPGLMFKIITNSINDVYVICKDGSVQSRTQPAVPVEWELVETENSWYQRRNNTLIPMAVSFYGWATDIPDGKSD
jgi:hypothetical protein